MVLEDLTKVVVDYGTAPEEKKVSVPTGNWAKVYQGSKKAPQHNLAMSFACKKMQTLKIN
ncbi:MAG: hypothetical protein P4M11_15695 [Candidatus Pacebacteria bacterium]|nr:hypothetical protein [Candidatus Paceibacterota bacterium]